MRSHLTVVAIDIPRWRMKSGAVRVSRLCSQSFTEGVDHPGGFYCILSARNPNNDGDNIISRSKTTQFCSVRGDLAREAREEREKETSGKAARSRNWQPNVLVVLIAEMAGTLSQ